MNWNGVSNRVLVPFDIDVLKHNLKKKKKKLSTEADYRKWYLMLWLPMLCRVTTALHQNVGHGSLQIQKQSNLQTNKKKKENNKQIQKQKKKKKKK